MKKILLTLIAAGAMSATAHAASLQAVAVHTGAGYGNLGFSAEFDTMDNLVAELGLGTRFNDVALVGGAKYFLAPTEDAVFFAGRAVVNFGNTTRIGFAGTGGYRFVVDDLQFDAEAGVLASSFGTGFTFGLSAGYRF